MQFRELDIEGPRIILPELREDNRGFFARTFCVSELALHGIDFSIVQSNISFNKLKGTVRGMHMQNPPRSEKKLVRVTRGSICDVIVDVRQNSPSYLRWTSVILSATNRLTLFVPDGFLHGFQTLEDESEILYFMSEKFYAASAFGVRWDDPKLRIRWPLEVSCISVKDLEYPNL